MNHSREERRRAQSRVQVKKLRQRHREALWLTTSEIHDRNCIITEHWCGQYTIIGRIKKREIFTSMTVLSHALYWGTLWDVKGAFLRLAADFKLSYSILDVDDGDRGNNTEEINQTKRFILPYWLLDDIRAVNFHIHRYWTFNCTFPLFLHLDYCCRQLKLNFKTLII